MQPLSERQQRSAPRNLQLDELGRLYDPRVRERLAATGSRAAAPALETLAALRQAAKQVHLASERWMEAHGLSESRFRVLAALYFSPNRRRPLRELAEMLEVVPRTMTDLADVLERDGLVERIHDTADRRSVHAQLTEAGLRLMETMKRSAFRRQAAALDGFGPEELAQLRHLCLTLVQQLQENP